MEHRWNMENDPDYEHMLEGDEEREIQKMEDDYERYLDRMKEHGP